MIGLSTPPPDAVRLRPW